MRGAAAVASLDISIDLHECSGSTDTGEVYASLTGAFSGEEASSACLHCIAAALHYLDDFPHKRKISSENGDDERCEYCAPVDGIVDNIIVPRLSNRFLRCAH